MGKEFSIASAAAKVEKKPQDKPEAQSQSDDTAEQSSSTSKVEDTKNNDDGGNVNANTNTNNIMDAKKSGMVRNGNASVTADVDSEEEGPAVTATAKPSAAVAAAVADVTANNNNKNTAAPPGRRCIAKDCPKHRRAEKYCVDHFKEIYKNDPKKVEQVLYAHRRCETKDCQKFKKHGCGKFCQLCFEKKNNAHVDDAAEDEESESEEGGYVIKQDSVPMKRKASSSSHHASTKKTKKSPAKNNKPAAVASKSKGNKDKDKGSSAKLCNLPGCQKSKQSGKGKNGLYCVSHSKLANKLLTQSHSENSKSKSIKPQFKNGTPVYAAWWSEDDEARTSEPSWYPGVTSSYRIGKKALDERYGFVRSYNIKYDDGDKLKDVPDHFVFAREDYELTTRLEEENPRNKNAQWRGVRNVTDKRSKDLWAKHVGWYVATLVSDGDDSGEKVTFNLLGEALRAYDVSVVRSKGVETKKSDLNLLEDWKGMGLFVNAKDDDSDENDIAEKESDKKQQSKKKETKSRSGKRKSAESKQKETQESGKKKAMGMQEKSSAKEDNEENDATGKRGKFSKGSDSTKKRKSIEASNKSAKKGAPAKSTTESDTKKRRSAVIVETITKVSEPATNIGPEWTREFFRTVQGKFICEYVSPDGTQRFDTVDDALNHVKLKRGKMEEMKKAGPAKRTRASLPEPTEEEKKKGGYKWTAEEIDTLIRVDEQYFLHKDRAAIMAERIPGAKESQCVSKISSLRTSVAGGSKNIKEIFGLEDIKSTLGKWTKEEIDLLMTLEDLYKNDDEEEKNMKIAISIPRWVTEECGLKTRFMRWQTKVAHLYAARNKKKEEREKKKKEKAESVKWLKKQKEEAMRKHKATALASVMGGAKAPASNYIPMAKLLKREDHGTMPPAMKKVDDTIKSQPDVDLTKKEATSATVATKEAPLDVKHVKKLDSHVHVPVPLSELQKKKTDSPARAKDPPESKKNDEKAAPSSESKIDESFVQMLNDDPYLGDKSSEQAQTSIEDLVEEENKEQPKKDKEEDQKPERKEEPVVESALEEPEVDTSC